MPKYVIPVTFTMYGKYEVEAENIEEALDEVFGSTTCLPFDAVYLDESLSVSEEDVNENNTLNKEDQEELSEYLADRWRAFND